MFIKDKDVLSEKNYEGNRLVEITDPTILALQEEMTELQKEINPHLIATEKLMKVLDPAYDKIGKLQQKITKLKDKMQSTKEKYEEIVKNNIEPVEARAVLIKNKITPLANKLVKDQLGEFERAHQVKVVNGKLYIEIEDRLETAIKNIRAEKNK